MSDIEVKATLRRDGVEYTVTQRWLPQAISGVEFAWTDGNYGCDCNRTLFIERSLGHDDPEGLACGDSIELVSLVVDGEIWI